MAHIYRVKVEAVNELAKFLHRDHLFGLYELVSPCHLGFAVENLVTNHEHDNVWYELIEENSGLRLALKECKEHSTELVT